MSIGSLFVKMLEQIGAPIAAAGDEDTRRCCDSAKDGAGLGRDGHADDEPHRPCRPGGCCCG